MSPASCRDLNSYVNFLGFKKWGLPELDFSNTYVVPHLLANSGVALRGPGEASRLVSKPYTYPAPGHSGPWEAENQQTGQQDGMTLGVWPGRTLGGSMGRRGLEHGPPK